MLKSDETFEYIWFPRRHPQFSVIKEWKNVLIIFSAHCVNVEIGGSLSKLHVGEATTLLENNNPSGMSNIAGIFSPLRGADCIVTSYNEK